MCGGMLRNHYYLIVGRFVVEGLLMLIERIYNGCLPWLPRFLSCAVVGRGSS